MSHNFQSFGPQMVVQLREQVNTLMAATSLLAPMVEKEEHAQYRAYLSVIYKNLYQLLRLTGNIEFTSLPDDAPILQMKVLDLAELCHTLSLEISSLSPMAQVEFSYQSNHTTLLTSGDATLLRRLILNLMSNAIKGAGKGGQVGLTLSTTKSRAMLTVWDNGSGLPFQESDHAVLDPSTGLGLGLEVARQITLLHQGTLLFDQKEEGGGRAIVSLPILSLEPGFTLYTPRDHPGGLSPVLVELSTVLSAQAFLPEDLD